MRTDIFFTRTTKPICNFANSDKTIYAQIQDGEWMLLDRRTILAFLFTGPTEILLASVFGLVANITDDGQVYLVQHYVIKFVSDLRQVNGFLRVLQFPPPIKLNTTIELQYC